MNIVIASGGFDPIHSGHIEYLEKAKNIVGFSKLICIVNSNEFLIRKKGYYFMDLEERKKIISSLSCVNEVIACIDKDDTVNETIRYIFKKYKNKAYKFIFAKGGDRFANEIPESKVCKELNIEIIDGLGKKIQSSSSLVEKMMKAKGEIK